MKLFQKTKEDLDAQEAYLLWDSLKSRYDSLALLQIAQNYIHDIDFKFLTSAKVMNTLQNHCNILEKTMLEYRLILPNRPAQSVHTAANTEVFEDNLIGEMFLASLQESLSLHLKAVRTSLTNDDIRALFVKLLKKEVDTYNHAVKYMKMKTWIEVPPAYKEAGPEQLDSGEAYGLWDHLSSRYDNLEITMIFSDYAHDPDFKALLALGINKLQKQIAILEKEMNKFGLPLPKRPPEGVNSGERPKAIKDEIMYRNIFTGMQYMIELHSTALKQNTTNDRLRTIYVDFLYQEIDTLDDWIKYGKVKGWLRPAPKHKT